MGNVIDICSNSDCEKPIYRGNQVWKRGSDLFCHIKCLYNVMQKEKATDCNQ